MLKHALQTAGTIALLSLAALLIRAQLVIHETRLLISDSRATVATLNAAASTWNTYSAGLTKQLQSERNQKAIDAGIAAAAALTGTIRLVNTQTVPRVNRSLDALESTTLSLNALVANTDKRLTSDDGLLPESTRLLASVRTTADAFQVDAKQLSAELLKITEAGQVSMASINAVLASSQWEQILRNIERGTSNLVDTTAELPEATKTIAGMLKVASKYQKPLLIAQIIAVLASAIW